MVLWLFILLQLFVVGESQSVNTINQTNLQAAVEDMRTWSYHGFVILLKILNSTNSSWNYDEITFFMPNDKELSKVTPNLDQLQDFIQSHSIPTALVLGHLIHFPNGTLVPSCVPKRMLTITNNGKSGIFLNNVRIVTPNVCLNSAIKCHGISNAISFGNIDYSLLKQGATLHNPSSTYLIKVNNTTAKSLPASVRRSPVPH